MFSSEIATKILNCLVNQGSANGNSGNTSISISTAQAVLELFTTLPGADGTGAVKVALSGYHSKALYGNGVSGVAQFGTAAAWDASEKKYIIKNTDEIQMHAISEDETGSAVVKGFGIYSGTTLLAWGKLVNESGQDATVTLSAGSVPIFYAGQFQLMLGEETSNA